MVRMNMERSNEECAKIAQDKAGKVAYNQVEDLQRQIMHLNDKITGLERELLELYRNQFGRAGCDRP